MWRRFSGRKESWNEHSVEPDYPLPRDDLSCFFRYMKMKRIVLILLCVLLAAAVSGCAKEAAVKNTIEGNMKTYYEMTDGTWMCDNRSYQYRLEMNGRMPNAAVDSSFVWLSNIAEISFEQAYMAAGLSSNQDDYFSPGEAVLVEMN